MTIRILINGIHGRMGQLALKTLAENADFTLVSTTNRSQDLAEEIKKNQPQVVIDFTTAEVVLANLEAIIHAGIHPVIGTSGLLKDQVAHFQTRCRDLKLGGIIAPNFSLGAVLMMKYAQEIAAYFPHVEIIEMHHTGKLDSPSGTAIRTAEMLAAARMHTPSVSKNSHETVSGARGANYQNIPIHAIRLPGMLANQQIIFGGTGETLALRHDATDRQCFMPGLILACKKVFELETLVYGLEHLL